MAGKKVEPEKEKLTTARVQRLKKPGYFWDSELPGFCVRVNPGGSKVYLARYRNDMGQQKWAKVGKHPVNTADEARIQAKSILGDSAKGLDPAETRDKKREAVTVQKLVDQFTEEHVSTKKPATVRNYTSQLKKFVLPVLGTRAVANITTADVSAALNKLRKTKTQWNRVYALLSKLFNMAERWGHRPPGSNPCRGLDKFKEEPRDRFLTDAELMAVGEALDTEQATAEQKLKLQRQGKKEAARAIDAEYIQAILAIKFLLFSGRRKSEALTLRWSAVDMDARTIRLETKTGGLTVDINDQMLEVLQAALAHRILGNPYVFPGRPEKPKPGEKKPEPKPWVNLMKPWERILETAGVWKKGGNDIIKPTIHDIRRTFGTVGAGDVELPHETIGKVLGHKQTSTTAIYARLAGKKRAEASAKIGSAMAKKLNKQA
ncbi:tyrosine-type recombinase/integrase [Geothrix sp.]|jgi:integrase|uniref:tyrosine-type recombinase/integrase n=1 Tax=Geothrix sp. TaxID=1962974 RepID=UPI0025B7F009|nr:tyrosine-type recombinase/integrase [Geothrix sp.]